MKHIAGSQLIYFLIREIQKLFVGPELRFRTFSKFCDLLTSGDLIMDKICIFTIPTFRVAQDKHFDRSITFLG